MKRQFFVLTGIFVILSSLFLVTSVLADQYKVTKGESLYTLSKKFGISVKEIKKENDLHSNAIKPGQILDIPEKSADVSSAKSKSRPKVTYIVKNGDTLGIIARKTGVPVKKLMALNNVRPTSLRIGRKLVLSNSCDSVKKDSLTEYEECLAQEEEEGDESVTENIALTELEKERKENEELLGKWNSPDERKLFIKVATGFLGAPYKMGGSSLKGIDCSAYVRKMYELFDVNLPRTAREQSTVGVTIEKEKLEEGDLIFFRTRRPIGHVGIYIGNNEFVHASRGSKVVRIDSLDQPYFQKRFRRAVRVKGLDNSSKGA